MTFEERRFIREAKRDIRLLMAQCSNTETWRTEASPAVGRDTELMARASAGGTANLAFFLPMFWRNRRA